MSLTQKTRSLGWPTYPFSGWLCLVQLPAWAGFLPGAGVLWVFSRSACAPQLRVCLCPGHPSESLNSCLLYQFPLFSMVCFALACLPNSSLPFRNCGTKSLPLTARGSFLRISIQLPTPAMKNPLWHHSLLHHGPVFAVRLCIPKSSAISALSCMH